MKSCLEGEKCVKVISLERWSLIANIYQGNTNEIILLREKKIFDEKKNNNEFI